MHKLNHLQQLLDNQNRTLALASKESCDLAKENDHLKAILAKDKINLMNLQKQIKNYALYGDNKPLDKKEMGDIVYEIYHYPSDHINIIKTMRQWKRQQQQQQQQDEIEINNQ